MIEIYWHEEVLAATAVGDDWLNLSELRWLRSTATLKRRSDWRAGRWVAKLAAGRYLGVRTDLSGLRDICIYPTAAGVPQLFYRSRPAPATISITHSAGRAACAIGPPGISLGCDLERVEPRSDAFIRDFFTRGEQDVIASAESPAERDVLATILWCGKESALKAVGLGLRSDTRAVELSTPVSRRYDRWLPWAMRFRYDFPGWYRCDNYFVRALVADSPTGEPAIWTKGS